MSAAQDSGRGRARWPEHLSLVTAPVEQRPRATAPVQRPPAQRPSAQQPARGGQPTARTAPRTQPPARVGGTKLSGPQLRRRWIGGIASALLVGLTLPVQFGAIAIESLELLSPGPDGSAMTVVLAAMAAQFVVVLIPMLVGPAIGGFSHRWRARLVVLGANAVLVCGIALIGWLRLSQL